MPVIIIKKISEVDLKNSRAMMNFTQVFWINCQGLDDNIQKFIENKFQFRINDEIKELDQTKKTIKYHCDNNKLVKITYRDITEVEISGNYHLFPFNELNFVYQVEIPSLIYQPNDNQLSKIIFNFHKHENINEMMIFREINMSYYIVFEDSKVTVKNAKENSKNPDKEYYTFSKLKMKMSNYQHPTQVFLTIFMPLLLISIFGAFIFAMDHDYNNRLINIGMLILTYVSFFQNIRQMLPQIHYLTMSDLFVVLYVLSTSLILLESYLDLKGQSEGFMLLTQIASYIFSGIPIIILLIQFIYFYSSIKRKFMTVLPNVKKTDRDLNLQDWILPQAKKKTSIAYKANVVVLEDQIDQHQNSQSIGKLDQNQIIQNAKKNPSFIQKDDNDDINSLFVKQEI